MNHLNTWMSPSAMEKVQSICFYFPPPSKKNRLTSMTFHGEFAVLVSEISATYKNILIFQDFNFHFDKQENSDTKQLLELLNSIGVSQRVCQPSHRQGHILDWVITWESPVDPIHSTSVEDLQLSDHFLVTVTTNMSKTRQQRKEVKCRNIKSLMPFVMNFASTDLFSHPYLM